MVFTGVPALLGGCIVLQHGSVVPATRASDVYMFGGLMYEVLTGCMPFYWVADRGSPSGSSLEARRSRGGDLHHVSTIGTDTGKVPVPTYRYSGDVYGDVFAKVVGVMGRCLGTDPQLRISSTDLAFELGTIEGSLSPPIEHHPVQQSLSESHIRVPARSVEHSAALHRSRSDASDRDVDGAMAQNAGTGESVPVSADSTAVRGVGSSGFRGSMSVGGGVSASSITASSGGKHVVLECSEPACLRLMEDMPDTMVEEGTARG